MASTHRAFAWNVRDHIGMRIPSGLKYVALTSMITVDASSRYLQFAYFNPYFPCSLIQMDFTSEFSPVIVGLSLSWINVTHMIIPSLLVIAAPASDTRIKYIRYGIAICLTSYSCCERILNQPSLLPRTKNLYGIAIYRTDFISVYASQGHKEAFCMNGDVVIILS